MSVERDGEKKEQESHGENHDRENNWPGQVVHADQQRFTNKAHDDKGEEPAAEE